MAVKCVFLFYMVVYETTQMHISVRIFWFYTCLQLIPSSQCVANTVSSMKLKCAGEGENGILIGNVLSALI